MAEQERRKKNRYRRWKRKFKDGLREQFWIVPATLIVVAVIALSAYWLLNSLNDTKNQSLRAQTQQNIASGYRDIVYKGKPYRYNSRITTILYAGVDTTEPLETHNIYMCGIQADAIQLLVFDEYHNKITRIALDRNTITKIHRYTYKGRDRGAYSSHLCFAYSYGDGGKGSCKNLCQAVSDLLYGIPVNDYVVTNLASFESIADIIGNVTVTVPNDDLAAIGLYAGQKAVINADNLETFVRYRDTNHYHTNVGRMERQRAYIDAASDRLMDLFQDDTSAMWHKIQRMEQTVFTNITRNHYLDLIKVLNKTADATKEYYSPTGEQRHGKFDEFYPDEDALLAKVIELFYIEK